MQIHRSRILGVDTNLPPDAVYKRLETMNKCDLKDGLRVVNVMRGK